jgi:hypothetical protein
MSTRDFRNHRARNKRLLDDPGLIILREAPTSSRSRDHLQPVHTLRLMSGIIEVEIDGVTVRVGRGAEAKTVAAVLGALKAGA